jgi:hypothetical protein
LSSTNSDRLHCERQYVIRTGTHQRLNLYVLTPKNKTEQKRIEREIKKTGTYKADYTIAEQETGLSPIVETELEPPTNKKKVHATRSLHPVRAPSLAHACESNSQRGI